MQHKTLPLSDALLQEFSDFIAAQIGLSFPRERWPDLLRGMSAMARELDFPGLESCMRDLMANRLTRHQCQMVGRHLTVGETYFFRDPGLFDTLEQKLLPQLIDTRRTAGKQLRIWSAGCCTGEEIYSIAILLDRLLPDLADWNITLLGTDVNPIFLDKARAGGYRDWSFRNMSTDIKTRYFERSAGGKHSVLPQLRQRVKFDYLNLMDDAYPGVASDTGAMDIVLCRNVLMYFSPVMIKQVIQKLHEALADDGWLIVSSAEMNAALFSQFEGVRFSDTVLYRKAGAKPLLDNRSADDETRWKLPVAPRPVSGHGSPRHSVKVADVSGNRQVATGDSPQVLASLARSYADQGRLNEAARCCEMAIAADKCNPAWRYLQAVILQENGQIEEAMAALKRVIYLDQNFVLAHFTLGSLCRRHGSASAAARHFGNAIDLLRRYSPGDILSESEGLTAGHLVDMIRACEAFA